MLLPAMLLAAWRLVEGKNESYAQWFNALALEAEEVDQV
jgi:hypothetical protein